MLSEGSPSLEEILTQALTAGRLLESSPEGPFFAFPRLSESCNRSSQRPSGHTSVLRQSLHCLWPASCSSTGPLGLTAQEGSHSSSCLQLEQPKGDLCKWHHGFQQQPRSRSPQGAAGNCPVTVVLQRRCKPWQTAPS